MFSFEYLHISCVGGGGGGCSHGWVPFTPPYPHLLNIDFLVIHWSSCITCFNCILVKFTNFWYQKYFSLISGGCNRDLLYPVCYLKCIITIVAAVALCPIGHHLEPACLQQAGLMTGSTLLGAWASGLQISPNVIQIPFVGHMGTCPSLTL